MGEIVTEKSAVVTSGVVEVAGRLFTVEKLPARQEEGLGNLLAKAAAKAVGKGGHFAAFKDELDWLRENGMAAEWQQLMATLPRLKLTGAPPLSVDEFRRTPKGAALELYHRTRSTHAEAKLDEIEAIVTEVNAPDVAFQIGQVLTEDGKSG